MAFPTPVRAQEPAAKPKGREERHTRHILIETEAEADDLIRRIQGGEDFIALCRQFSLDAVTKKIGGDLDWLRRNDASSIEKAVFSIPQVGGVAKAKTQYGWHVVQYAEQRFVEGAEEKPAKEKPAPKEPKKKPGEKPLKEPATPKPDGEQKMTPEKPKRRVRNEDLAFNLSFERPSFSVDDAISFTIEVTNKSQAPLMVFHPLTWPLGLNGRYHGNAEAKFDIVLPKGGAHAVPRDQLFRELGAGETLKQSFELGDYVADVETWPIIRFSWRGEEFLKRLEAAFSEVAQHKDLATWKERWSSYSAGPANFSVLPDYDPESKWYARFIFGGATSNVWVELVDPKIPGFMEHWIHEAANGAYAKSSLARDESGTFITGGEKSPPPKPFTLPPGAKVPEVGPRMVVVAAGGSAGVANVDMRLYFTLADAAPVKGKGIPIGKVVQNEELLDKIAAGEADMRHVRPEITVVELYPEESMPNSVRDMILHGISSQPQMNIPDDKRKRDLDVPAPPPAGVGENSPVVELVVEDAIVRIELFEDLAPNTVANFISLIDKSFYDGLSFHARSEDDQNLGWVQGGSPNGKDTGELDFSIKDEFNPSVKHDKGSIAMAGARDGSKDSASCQFYICFAKQPQLDGKFTVFGRVLDGLSELERMPVPATIRSVKVIERRSPEYQPQKISRTPPTK